MPQLLLIKEANTPHKKVGDVVGVYEDAHKFSVYEQEHFYIEKVLGFKSALELKKALPYPEIKVAYRTSIANKWSFAKLEEKECWKDTNGKWCDYTESTKFRLNFYALTTLERKTLSEATATLTERQMLLNKCENRIKNHAANLMEITDLN